MKMRIDAHEQIQRTGSPSRRHTLALVIVMMLLAVNLAQATIIISASEASGNVVFNLNGSVDLNTMLSPTTGGPGLAARIWPSLGLITYPTFANLDVYALPSFTSIPSSTFGDGPSSFASASTYSSAPGFGFIANPSFGFPPILELPQGSTGSGLDLSMTFDDATFASLGITPGIYTWTWSNGDASDNLILNVGQPVPDTGTTVALLTISLGGVLIVYRRRGRAA